MHEMENKGHESSDPEDQFVELGAVCGALDPWQNVRWRSGGIC